MSSLTGLYKYICIFFQPTGEDIKKYTKEQKSGTGMVVPSVIPAPWEAKIEGL
jgi:hypothetical protein